MSSRKRLIAGNWKMFKTRAEATAFADRLVESLQQSKALARGATSVESVDAAGSAGSAGEKQWPEALICAPFTALVGLAERLAPADVALGAQTMSEQPEGAFTGEISAAMLQELGVSYVILGHSERRAYFAESDAAVAAKAVAALRSGMAPIVCVGETLAEREGDRTEIVIRSQLEPVLAALGAYRSASTDSAATESLLASVVIAYEPVWAIGSGKSSSAADAQAVIGYIRTRIQEQLGTAVASSVRILYGGSVKPDNIGTYLAQVDIDGALVGGASLKHDSFLSLLQESAL